MNHRIAKKIVQRVQAGATTYSRDEVERAFGILGLTPPAPPPRLRYKDIKVENLRGMPRMVSGVDLAIVPDITAATLVANPLAEPVVLTAEAAASAPVQMSRDESRAVLANLTMTELRDMAKTKGFRGYSKMAKSELVEALLGKAA